MGLLWLIIRKLLFLFDAESVHRLTVKTLKIGLSGSSQSKSSDLNTKVFGIDFLNPVGLAAGFDKDAEILNRLPGYGFGFVEIGTVTPRPQPGNDLPRLFREPAKEAIFNRMGFNSLGADHVARELEKKRLYLPEKFRIGVNIGKNKDTSLENAHEDYALAIVPFKDLADYIVINVSSPNTPGLRELQTKESLKKIIDAVMSQIKRGSKVTPLVLKLAPEVKEDQLKDILMVSESLGVDGFVLTNTLAGIGPGDLTGGWSGAVLSEKSRQSLVQAREVTKKPIISVGGIMTKEEALTRMKLGASLIQIYTGWIYQGPGFPKRIVDHLKKSVWMLFFLISTAFSAQDGKITAHQSNIYEKPDSSSTVLEVVSQGWILRMSEGVKNGFYRVGLTQSSDHKKFGWISSADIAPVDQSRELQFAGIQRSETIKRVESHTHLFAGGDFGMGYHRHSDWVMGSNIGAYFGYRFTQNWAVSGNLQKGSASQASWFLYGGRIQKELLISYPWKMNAYLGGGMTTGQKVDGLYFDGGISLSHHLSRYFSLVSRLNYLSLRDTKKGNTFVDWSGLMLTLGVQFEI